MILRTTTRWCPLSNGEGYSEKGPAAITWDPSVNALVVQLPHQCDEWVIGGAEEVRALMADLEALLSEFEHPDRYRHCHVCPRCQGSYYLPDAACTTYCRDTGAEAVCARCFYPAKQERREACQHAYHPTVACLYPLCMQCRRCQQGCSCQTALTEATRSFPSAT